MSPAASPVPSPSASPSASLSASPSPLGGRNLWAVSLASFFTDVASEMVLRLVPLYLVGTLGLRISAVGLIEGVAESVASLLKVFSGGLSDRLGSRKGLAVAGYALSTACRPFFAVAESALGVALVRWGDRVGKGIRTAPRDALVADSVAPDRRGFAFGLQRAADNAGAFLGLAVAWAVVAGLPGDGATLDAATFRRLALASLVPGVLAVLALAVLAREVPPRTPIPASSVPRRGPSLHGLRGLGRPFAVYLGIVALFELGNSADAFLVLRASERGLSIAAILAMLVGFNAVNTLATWPAGILSDRVGRGRVLVAGWWLYAAVYLGLAWAETGRQVVVLALVYGLYHGLTAGAARALVADLVPAERRGTAYGLFAAVVGLLALPASVIAGVLWKGIGAWPGLGPAAPFTFGAAAAFAASLLLLAWRPDGSAAASPRR